MRKLLCCLALIALLSGCHQDSDREMIERFGRGSHVFVEKSTGDEFVVIHYSGRAYSIYRLENNVKSK